MLSAAAALAVCRHRAVSKLLVLVSALMLLIMVTVAQGVEDSEQHPIYSLYRTYLMGEVSIGDNAAFTRNNTIPRVSNSFNLGELVGMLPRTTILPILAFWYAMAMVLSILVERAKGRSLSAPG
jgi:hypothetical protein